MPVYDPQRRKQIVPSSDTTPGERRGGRRTQQLVNQRGIPRFDDLITVRLLEETPTIGLPMNTATRQAKRIPIDVVPSVDNPTPTHNMIADRIHEFLDGNFNRNDESWDHFLTLVLKDIISIDSGVVELVPTAEKLPHPQDPDRKVHWLSEMYAGDGSVVSKNRTDTDTIPEAPEPAYFKFGNMPNVSRRFADRSTDITSLFRSTQIQRFARGRNVKPVPYSRDEMLFIEENPRPAQSSAYGFGIVQQARRWAEILLNQDLSNIQHFSDDELAKGVFNIGIENASEVEDFRQYWKDEVRGNTDTALPIAALDDTAEWIPFQPSLKELQYLESQQWYSELVWYLFGQTQSEIGQTEDANVSTSEHDTFQVFTNTTRPRLQTIAEMVNDYILPKLRDYWIVNGEVEFKFAYDEHPMVQERLREKRRDDLTHGVTTPNRVLEAEGKEAVPWGDMPSEAISAFAREHPEWVAENWGGVDDVPEPASDEGGLFSANPSPNRDSDSDSDTSAADAADGAEFESSGTETRRDFSDGGTAIRTHRLRDALRKDDDSLRELPGGGDFADLKQFVDAGQERVANAIRTELERVEEDLIDLFPEERQDKAGYGPSEQKALPGLDAVLDRLDMTDALTGAITNVVGDAMEEQAEFDAAQVEAEIADRVDGDTEVSLDFDVRDTFAFERMKRQAASDMVSVNETIKESVRDTLVEVSEDGGNVNDATEALRDEVDELSESHARLVARTETLTASRHGSQALNEGSDLIEGKEWDASGDGRTRPWHAEMDGVIVATEEDFTVPAGWEGEPDYQPSDYPRAAYVVGDDQPFNCRCAQNHVLREDMPEAKRALATFDEVTVYENGTKVKPLSDRQMEIWSEWAGQKVSWDAFWSAKKDAHTWAELKEKFGVSDRTISRWS